MNRLWLAAAAVLLGCALQPPHREPAAQVAREAPLTGGNDAQLLIDGPRAHRAMFDAMERARDHIDLQSYILEAGEVGEHLVAVLEKKVKQGVKVQVLYDSVGSIGTPKEYFARLRDAGVGVCEINPVKKFPDKANNRDHRKILVVDGRVAFTGGINIANAYSSGSASARRKPGRETKEKAEQGWRDTQVQVEGPVVAQFQRSWLDAWALQDCGPAAKANYFPRLSPKGEMEMRLVRADPQDGSEMYSLLLSRIERAKARVWLTVGYFVPDPRTKQVLIDAARRGVDVRLMLPGFSDFWAPVYAGRSHYDELLDAGVGIYEWHEALMHAKTAVIDSEWSSVGSTNLDWRSFVHNWEADVIILDQAFAREMERRFQLDVEASVAIDRDQWRKRGTLERFKEWVARRWEYLL